MDWNDKVCIHVYDRSAGHLLDQFRILDFLYPVRDFFVIDTQGDDHVLAAIMTGKTVYLSGFLSHANAHDMRLTAR